MSKKASKGKPVQTPQPIEGEHPALAEARALACKGTSLTKDDELQWIELSNCRDIPPTERYALDAYLGALTVKVVKLRLTQDGRKGNEKLDQLERLYLKAGMAGDKVIKLDRASDTGHLSEAKRRAVNALLKACEAERDPAVEELFRQTSCFEDNDDLIEGLREDQERLKPKKSSFAKAPGKAKPAPARGGRGGR